MRYQQKGENIYKLALEDRQLLDFYAEELVEMTFKSNMSNEEAVNWIKNVISYIDKNPLLFSSILQRKLEDVALEKCICPECGIPLEELPYMVQHQYEESGATYYCPECEEEF